jgi:hypothetical protein
MLQGTFDTLVVKDAAKEKKNDTTAIFGQEGCDKMLNESNNVVKKAPARGGKMNRRRKSTIEDLIDKLDIANAAALLSGVLLYLLLILSME